ncbi:MAG: YggT family protein [Pseudomonadales bacterium]
MDALLLIIRTLGELYIFVLLLRFMLQLAQADYYNPISQGVVKITTPVISPLQRLLPKAGRMDLSPILAGFAVKALLLFGLITLVGHALPATSLIVYAAVGLLNTFLDICFYAVLGSVIISWIAPDSYHPAPQLIMQITAPLYKLVQKVVPPIGGFDLSPIVIFIVIQIVQAQLRPFII